MPSKCHRNGLIHSIPNVGLLHAANLAKPGEMINEDIILTSIAIAGGTKPIHEFIDALTSQGDKKDKKKGNA